MRTLLDHLRSPYQGPARYKVFGHELTAEFALHNIPLPRINYEPGWYVGFSFGSRGTDALFAILYEFGDSE